MKKLLRYKIYIVSIFAGLGLSLIGLFVYLNFGKLNFTDIREINILGLIPKAYIVQSGSMEPAIKTGSIVISYPSPIYSAGDAITFAKTSGSKNLITHRIEARYFPEGINKDPVYQTSGDANEDFDPGHVEHAQVVGKVVLTVPYLGYVANFAKQPYGFILLVIVPATIVIYEELKSVFQELGKSLKRFYLKIKERKSSKKPDVLSDAVQNKTHSNSASVRVATIIPIVGAAFVFIGLASSFFADKETSQNNVLQAASSFGEKSAAIYNSDPFTCPLGATSTDGSTFGSAIIKIVNTDLNIFVKLSSASPNTVYDIWINQDPGSCPLNSPSFPAEISTDGSGNGTSGNLSLPFVPGATNFWVSAVGGGQVLRSVSVTLP